VALQSIGSLETVTQVGYRRLIREAFIVA
jgi:hypothetical protein